jgi:hypothetical protein
MVKINLGWSRFACEADEEWDESDGMTEYRTDFGGKVMLREKR